jgi:hypothetical protein
MPANWGTDYGNSPNTATLLAVSANTFPSEIVGVRTLLPVPKWLCPCCSSWSRCFVEEAVAGGRADQAAHVVIRKRIGPRRIVHLRDLPYQVVHVIDRGGIRILLGRQAIQRVIEIRDRLALAVGLLCERVRAILVARL